MQGTVRSIYETPKAIRIAAKIISFVFHPLFIPLYLTLYLVFIQKFSFLPVQEKLRDFILIHIAVFSVFFPAFSTFLLWKLNFSDNIYLRTQKERIIPYSIVMILFFWSFYIFRSQPEWPQVMTQLYLGIFICTIFALVINNFIKISMHAMGMGGALAFMLVLLFNGLLFSITPLIVTVGITGLVCSARLILDDHRPVDVYIGLLAGMASQLIASRFVTLH